MKTDLMVKEYEIQVEIVNQCYLNCQHCSSFTMRHSQPIMLKEEELVRFIRIFEGALHVYFTGGEPLAHPDLISMIQYTKNALSNTSVGIFTCGILQGIKPIDIHYAKELKKCGLDDCYISLYHYSNEKHDLITNQFGSHIATMESIHNLLEANIDVKVHLVINRHNFQELNKVIANIFETGVSQIRLLRIVKTGAADKNWATVGVSYEKQDEAVRAIISDMDRYPGAITISGFPCETPCRPSPNARKCQAGTHLLYVTNSKEVYPCACTKGNPAFLLGSINDLSKIKLYLDSQQNCECNEECLNPITPTVT